MCKTKKEVIEIDPSIALSYGIKQSDIKSLMELKSIEATEKVKQTYGGKEGLARKLNSNLVNGLSADPQDILNRQAVFGKNVIPPKPPKSFFKLVFEALQDVTLIVLIGCAVISIGLSFYHPPDSVISEEYRSTGITAFGK
jgi:P-type Ca2+ transporter type 2B